MSNTDRWLRRYGVSGPGRCRGAFALVLRIFVAAHNIRNRIRLESSWLSAHMPGREAVGTKAHIRADILIVFLTALELPSWNLYTALNRVLTGAKADLGAKKTSVSASLPADPVSADLTHKA